MNPLDLAKRKAMDLIAQREHSEAELRAKLSRQADLESVEAALDFVRAQGWLTPDLRIAEKTAEQLHKRLRGIEYINQYLQAKGLPEVAADWDFELEKARSLVKNKKSANASLDETRLARFLLARGFDSETVRKALHEEL